MIIKQTKLFILLFLLGVCTAKAQRYQLVFGPELNIPSGNSTNVSPIGYGGSLKAEIGLTDKYSITASAAAISFLGKKIFGPRQASLNYLPLKLGLKYYTESSFYLEGQLGAALPLSGSKGTRFVWSPGAGTVIKNKNGLSKFDLGLRYEGWNDFNTSNSATFAFFSLRAGYIINL